MFGYVKTDLPNMYVKDTVLYKSMYCSLCKGLGKCCGNKSRFVLNYDLSFLSIFLHNVLGVDVEIEKKHCLIHWIRKRPIAKCDKITETVSAFNMILAHYKMQDDIIDDNKSRVKSFLFRKEYKRAKKLQPELDKIVKKNYLKLRSLEKEGCDSIDVICDPFSLIISNGVSFILDKNFTKPVENVCYNLGKWIYLIDALDDYDKDIKKKNYNVLFNIYKSENYKKLIEEHKREIVDVFADITGAINENSKLIEYKFNHDLIDNVFILGIKQQTKKILEKK